MVEVLIDTNILVYAHHPAETVKHRQAIRAIETLTEAGAGRLSSQILAEFVSATTRDRRPILALDDTLAQATRLVDAMPVLDVTRMIVLEALRGVREHRLSYFDAQIWATARLNQVPVVFTEDFQDGRRLEGVEFLNPLMLGFGFAEWA